VFNVQCKLRRSTQIEANNSFEIAAGGIPAAKLLARNLQRSKEKEQSRARAATQREQNDPTAWVLQAQAGAKLKEAAEEERKRSLMAGFTATAAVDDLEGKMRRIDLDANMLSDCALSKVWEQLKNAGITLAGGGRRADDIAIIRYRLLQGIVTLRKNDRIEALETRVFPVKQILAAEEKSAVLIVTLKREQCWKQKIHSTMQRLHEGVKVEDIICRVSAANKAAPAISKLKTHFPPAFEIKLRGGGGCH
jgi:hypothetical protein